MIASVGIRVRVYFQPASPVTLPTVPQPARTAPPVVKSLSFLYRAPSPDARRVLTGRPAVGRAGPFRFRFFNLCTLRYENHKMMVLASYR